MSRQNRRALLRGAARLGLSAAGLVLTSSACEQLPAIRAAKVPRIGCLAPGPRESRADRLAAFLEGLRELGYIEGRTIRIEWRFTLQGKDAQFAELAADLVRIPVDMIVAEGSTPRPWPHGRRPARFLYSLPSWLGPRRPGWCLVWRTPGGNLTASTSTPTPPLSAKQLELMREVVPFLTRVAALVDASNPAYDVVGWHAFRTAADEAGVLAERIDLWSATDVDAALEAAASHRADAVFDVQNPLLLPVRTHYAALGLQHRLPCMSGQREYVVAGHFMSYGPDYPALYRQAAVYVDKISRESNQAICRYNSRRYGTSRSTRPPCRL